MPESHRKIPGLAKMYQILMKDMDCFPRFGEMTVLHRPTESPSDEMNVAIRHEGHNSLAFVRIVAVS